MKIAYVYDAVYPWEKGGAQKRVWELARRLASDHDVHLYGMHYWDGPSEIKRDGVTLHGVCAPMELYIDGRRSILQALTFAGKVAGPLLNEGFDVVDCQAFPYFPCFIAKGHQLLKNSTLVITWYEVWDNYWYEYLGQKGILGKAVERAAMELPEVIVPISPYVADNLRAVGCHTDLQVVENGVDCEGLQGVEPADDDWDVIYAGRLAEHKNIDLLIDSMAILSDRLDRDVSCGIIGNGPEFQACQDRVRSHGVNHVVEFLGFLEDDTEVIANIKAADVFVLPSMREGFPNTILEANANGVPSIVVDHEENGSTAIVEDGETGYITDMNATAIANRIEEVLSDEETYEALSAEAKTFAREHDWSVITAELEQVYRDAVGIEGMT